MTKACGNGGRPTTARFGWAGLLTGLAALAVSSCSVEQLAGLEPPAAPAGAVTLTEIATLGPGARVPLSGGDAYRPGYIAAIAARSGSVFVVDSVAGGLIRLDPGFLRAEVLLPLADATTRGLAVTVDQLVYVVDRQQRAVLELSGPGGLRRYEDPVLLPAPVDVALTDWDRTLVAADELTARLVLFDSLAGPTGVLGGNVAAPRIASQLQAIAGASHGVYLLDAALSEVVRFDLAGRPLATYGEDDLGAAVALAADACGRVYVADGSPAGLFVAADDPFGRGMRARLGPTIGAAITDLWVDGDELYVAAGAAGLAVYGIAPGCPQ